MYLTDVDARVASSFSYKSLDDLVEACIDFYRKSLKEPMASFCVRERRSQLAGYIRKFHSECGTLTPSVEEAIGKLEDDSCLVLMTAHQPNLFAYGGVLRKATLNHILAKKMSERLSLPVVSFFGLSDQDFTDDRWVKSALLPDVERRGGVLELRVDLPEKLRLNAVGKPSEKMLDRWQAEIKKWIGQKLNSVEKECRALGVDIDSRSEAVHRSFEEFWTLVEGAHVKAQTCSDFNGFLMSKVINEVWGYDTVFARFSECQQILEEEFCFLLSRFDEYSKYVSEATAKFAVEGGVFEQERETIPFWYHCVCGSKARLTAEQTEGRFVGRGQCLRCGEEYRLDFGSKDDPHISEYISRISARSLSVPLVFFSGLRVGCYVGGVGGKEYLKQAEYVAERLGLSFPPVVVWRPRDEYFGLGQLDALFVYRHVSGSWDLTLLPTVEIDLRKKAELVQSRVDELEADKKLLGAKDKEENDIEKLKALSARQSEIRRLADFSVLVRNIKLLESVSDVMHLYPCVIDYAVNVGLRETSEQWKGFLRENGDLSSDIHLKTRFEEVAKRFPS